MKKTFLIVAFVFLFNVAGFAGWADSMRQPCDPGTAKPNTCFWHDDVRRNAGGDSPLAYIKTLIAAYIPLVYFFN